VKEQRTAWAATIRDPAGERREAVKKIPSKLLDRPVSGWNLAEGTLRDQLHDDAFLLVFLRHFG
jgi:hypothetical protein